MNSTRSFKCFLALALLAACFSPPSLKAQPAYRGRFTLPFEIRWGTMVLPAGNYSFTMQSATDSGMVAVRGEHARALIMNPVDIRESKVSDVSHLIVVRSGRKGTVRALYLGPLGMTFYYRPPKADTQFVAQAPQLIQRVPVSVTGT